MDQPDVLRVLHELVAEVAALRVELRAAVCPSPHRPLAPRDRDWLSRLLPAINAAAGDAVLTTAELAGLALHRDNEALALALERRVGGAGGLRVLGKGLSRCGGHVVGGLELRHVGNASGVALWQCVRVSNSRQTLETIAADTASPRAAG